jgi:hypothetical protein
VQDYQNVKGIVLKNSSSFSNNTKIHTVSADTRCCLLYSKLLATLRNSVRGFFFGTMQDLAVSLLRGMLRIYVQFIGQYQEDDATKNYYLIGRVTHFFC